MTTNVAAAKPRLRGPLTYDERAAFLFVAPLAVVLMAVAVFPILYSFYISLFSAEADAPGPNAVRRARQLRHRAVRSAVLVCGRAHRLLRRDLRRRRFGACAAGRAAAQRGISRTARAQRRAAGAVGDSIRRQRADVEVDLRFQLRRAQRAALPARLHQFLHGLARRFRQDAGADRQCVRLEGGAAGHDPAAGRPEDHSGRSVCRRKGRRRQRHAAGSSTSRCRR